MSKLSLARRHFRPEIMDQPHLDASLHEQALCGLVRLNLASGVYQHFWRQIQRCFQMQSGATLRVLDVASGGGDIPFRLWNCARRRGVNLRIVGIDSSPAACRFAAHRCQAASGSITFLQADAIREPLPRGFDVVTCSLFLHHLTSAQASELLHKMADAGRLLLVSDLRRGMAGYVLAQVACRLFTSSPVVRLDGPQSVANAFTLAEMRELCLAAGLVDAKVRAAWPCRLMIIR